MPAGRPKSPEKMAYLRVWVPEKYLTVADHYDIPYKKNIRDIFERMVCTAIKTNRGDTDCEICENAVKRNQMIEKELTEIVEILKREQQESAKVEREMAAVIQQAVIDGKTRGEAESEYGRVFPDAVWKKYSVVKP